MVADSLSLVAVLSLLAPNGSSVISMVRPSPYLVDIFVVVPVATAYLGAVAGLALATLAVFSLVPLQSLAVFSMVAIEPFPLQDLAFLRVEALAVVSETLAHTLVEAFPLELLVHRQRF